MYIKKKNQLFAKGHFLISLTWCTKITKTEIKMNKKKKLYRQKKKKKKSDIFKMKTENIIIK